MHANSVRSGLVASTATLGMKMPVVWHLHDTLPQAPLFFRDSLPGCDIRPDQPDSRIPVYGANLLWNHLEAPSGCEDGSAA